MHKILSSYMSAAEPFEELVARSTFLFAVTFSGIQSVNSWKKQLVFLYRDVSRVVSFAVLDDQNSSTSLSQWLAVLGNMYLDQSRLSFFSSEP